MANAITESYGWDRDHEHAHGAADYLNPAILKLVHQYAPRDVLDAGCGIGSLCADLAAAGYNVVGVDGDAGGIGIARAAHPGVRFETATFDGAASELQATADGLFDCVVSTEVIEHLYAPHELVRFCYEALRPGGALIITTPYHGYWKNLALSLTNKWDYHLRPEWYGGHIKFWSPKTLGRVLRDAGFEEPVLSGVGRIPYLWKSMVLVAKRPGTSKTGDAR
jgi:2-polyprenyl-6-hydroxyphenyl methylase/3-demethylubiquinone-9 3-methyltransferase